MHTTSSEDLRDRDDMQETHRAEAVALGRAWAREKAEEYRRRGPGAQWPDFWDDADDGPLPIDAGSASAESLRRTANRAAREHWRELVADQRASEDGEDDEPELQASAELEARARASLPAPRLEAPPSTPEARALGDVAEPVLVNWRA